MDVWDLMAAAHTAKGKNPPEHPGRPSAPAGGDAAISPELAAQLDAALMRNAGREPETPPV